MNGEMSKKSTTPSYWAKAGTTIRSTQVGRTTSDPLSIKNRI